MNDILRDTSWTLHYVSANSDSYRSIFSSPTQLQLQKYTDRLTQYLAQTKPQYSDDLDDENEKLGTLRECKWSSFTTPTTNHANVTIPPTSISIILTYQKQTYKFILHAASLILTRSSPSHTTRLFNFLSQTFSISIDNLKLPPSLLSTTLASYITSLSNHPHSDPNDNNEATHPSLFKTAITNLKLTISFSSPIAPNLRTIDIDVPHDTIQSLLPSPFPSHPSSSSTSGSNFLTSLSNHITQQTGLKLPLSPIPPPISAEDDAQQPPFHLSRITTTAFAIGIEGKIKFSSKAIENAIGLEDVIRLANGEMLGLVEQEARKRGEGRGTGEIERNRGV